MSIRTLDRVLRRLISYGEIIVRGNSRFSIITICDYDSLTVSESLFGSADGISGGTTDGISGGTTDGTTLPLNIKEGRIEDSLITPFSPYKTERDAQDVVTEIKRRYNKFFDGQLPPLLRLHLPIRNMVLECIRRFGMQSVDIVFEQVLHEKFSMGGNKTGFVASFQFIFEPANFQKYLERAQLRKKKYQPQPGQEHQVGTMRHEEPAEQKQERRQFLMGWVTSQQRNPTVRGRQLLTECYNSGELQRLGIDWQPDGN